MTTKLIAHQIFSGMLCHCSFLRYIKHIDYTYSAHNLNIKASIDEYCTGVFIDVEEETKGYYSVFLQPYLGLIKKTDLEKAAKELSKNLFGEVILNKWEFVNIEPEVVGKKPLIFKFNGYSPSFIENAGDHFLFKVGLIIGPQVELYKQEDRSMPVYDDYKRHFNRHIEIKIPEGYIVKNLEKLNMLSEYVKDGKTKLLFKSSYEYKDNILRIDIIEFYDMIYYELEEYEKYREVINAAADFNKIVLILVKQ